MHLVTGKICCCFVDVSTHLMYFKRKQTTNCLSKRVYWHVCGGRLGWRMWRSSHQIIVISCLPHGLYEEITSLLPSGLLGLRGGFTWHRCDKHIYTLWTACPGKLSKPRNSSRFDIDKNYIAQKLSEWCFNDSASNRRKYSIQCTRDEMYSCQSRVIEAQFSLQVILFKDGTIGQEVQHTHTLLRAWGWFYIMWSWVIVCILQYTCMNLNLSLSWWFLLGRSYMLQQSITVLLRSEPFFWVSVATSGKISK